MKKLFLLVFLFTGTVTLMAQEGVTLKQSKTLKLEEVPPTWPGCTGSINQKNNCLRQKLANHAVKNMKFAKDHKQGAKIIVDMVINKEGKPVIKKVEGGTPGMQQSVKNAILSMPQIKPGNIGGTAKESKLTLPFQF